MSAAHLADERDILDPRSEVARLVASALDDSAAFEVLMRSRLPRTYRLAMAILGSESEANDAVQEAWVAAWRQLGSLADRGRFDPWIDQIIVNACRMIVRRRARVREIRMPDGFDVSADAPGPDHIAEREALERAFDRLSVDQRSILVLHHLERRSLASIAGVLGVPVGTAKSRLHAARAALERTLELER